VKIEDIDWTVEVRVALGRHAGLVGRIVSSPAPIVLLQTADGRTWEVRTKELEPLDAVSRLGRLTVEGGYDPIMNEQSQTIAKQFYEHYNKLAAERGQAPFGAMWEWGNLSPEQRHLLTDTFHALLTETLIAVPFKPNTEAFRQFMETPIPLGRSLPPTKE